MVSHLERILTRVTAQELLSSLLVEKNHSEELLGWKRMRNLPETPASHLTLHIQFCTCQDPEPCSQHKAKQLSGEVCEHYELDGIAG